MVRIEYLLVLRLHEVIADHMESDHVPVFNTAHVGIGHLNIELGQRAQFATITTRKGDGPAASGIRIFDRAEHVGGISRTTDGHYDITSLGKVLQLLDEYAIIVDII